ncbi:MAG: HNH endonuclease [Escherichia sp.]
MFIPTRVNLPFAIDHDHTNNPEDGSNWELLCLYCHDHEHSKYTEADQYGMTVIAGRCAKMSVKRSTTHSRFESDDEQEEVIKNAGYEIRHSHN